MTTARCFGGALDGTWRRQPDGQELLAPVMDYDYKAMTIEPDEPLRCGMRVHRYTLQKFFIGREWVQKNRYHPVSVWDHEPIFFYALIGPGFTVAMVKAWLDGWMEEADSMRRVWKRNNLARHYGMGDTLLTKLTKDFLEARQRADDLEGTMDHDAEKARTVIAQMERRLGNQKATIDGLQRDVDRVQTQNRQLAVDLRDAQADLRSIRTVRDNAVAAQVRIREKMQEHLRARIKAENSLTEARRQRGAQARRAERAEAALQDPFGPGYAKDRIEALHRMLAGAQEDRQQLQEQRDFVSARLSTVIGERDEARERCNKAVVIGRRLLDQGRTFAAVHRMIDALFGR